jgi:hypothetical protein
MFILEYLAVGFITAFGWWGANHYVIEPHFPEPIVVTVPPAPKEQK